jgi:hypothetical protein
VELTLAQTHVEPLAEPDGADPAPPGPDRSASRSPQVVGFVSIAAHNPEVEVEILPPLLEDSGKRGLLFHINAATFALLIVPIG